MGGVEREVPEGAQIGFHQFYGGASVSPSDTMETAQYISALLAGYLRDMGANPELFELLSATSPGDMYIPGRSEIAELNIVPHPGFSDFKLMPKDGMIVATATNEQNPGTLEKVYEIETMCWKGAPIINLYATSDDNGLTAEMASRSTTHIDGFRIDMKSGSFEYGVEHIRLYPNSRILASLMIDPVVARALANEETLVAVNSYTASGVFMSGTIIPPPGGDQAILASFRDCF